MTVSRRALAVILSFTVLLASGSLQAVEFFSEDFSEDRGMLVDTGGAGASEVVGGQLLFSGGGDAGRTYVGTPDTDYNTVSFVAEVDVTIQGDFSNALFFGMGAGERSTLDDGNQTDRGFDQPTVGPAVFIGVRENENPGDLLYTGDFGLDDGNENTFEDGNQIGPQPAEPLQVAGTHRLRMEHDHVAQEIRFFIDVGITGEFQLMLADQTVLATDPFATELDPPVVVAENGVFDVSDNGYDGTNARIFFGSSNNRVFDNFSVAPLDTGLAGDFDDDGDVDGADALAWQRDPTVGSLDDWEANFGATSPPGVTASSIPEPTTALLCTWCFLIVETRRRRACRNLG